MRISFKHQFNTDSKQTGGMLAVNNIIMSKDFPMNGIYIPIDIFKASLELWTNAPIVAPDHVEAETEANTFGRITRAFIDGDKLMADAVVDLDKLNAAYPILYNKIVSGQAVSGSIAVWAVGFETNGNYNNRSFNFITTSITEVYHYALLQDEPGACDIVDGCGVNLSATKTKEVSMTTAEIQALLDANNKELISVFAKLSANQATERPAKLDVTHVKPCEFNQLVERVTANEATAVTLQAAQAKVAEENESLKTEVLTLKAALAQFKNNNTGTDVKGDTESEQTKYLL